MTKIEKDRLNRFGVVDGRLLTREDRKRIRHNRTSVGRYVTKYEFICPACQGPTENSSKDLCVNCRNELHRANGTRPESVEIDQALKVRLKKYGLSATGYQRLVVLQDGACAICAGVPAEVNGLVVDHNHATGEVRGLLCSNCNTALGLLQDSPDILEAALQYLEERGCYGANALAEEEG